MSSSSTTHDREHQRATIAALLSMRAVGYAAVHRISEYLTKHECRWADFWVQSARQLQEMGVEEKQIHSIQEYKKEHNYYSEYQSMHLRDIQVVLSTDEGFPSLLRRTTVPVPALFMRSVSSVAQSHVMRGIPVAVVGTRRATAYGSYVTTELTQALVRSGCIIASGGMYGIDLIAHQAALAAGGNTWVFLGHGFDHCYPDSVRLDHERLAAAGAVFWSPFSPGTRPSKFSFPMRNQIVAGSSAAVVVTEAAARSGSHITARCAIDEGRSVFAVPGAITNPYSSGTLALINQGAVLAQSADQIMGELLPSWGQLLVGSADTSDGTAVNAGDTNQVSQSKIQVTAQEQLVLDALAAGLGTPALLAQSLKLSFSDLQQTLTMLELRRLIIRKGGQLFLS